MRLNGMIIRKRLFAIFATTVLSCLVSASGAVRLGGNGFRFQMVPLDPGGNSSGRVAVADCAVRVNQRDVLLHWTTTPFSHIDDPNVTSDAFLSATLISEIGQINVSPHRAIDRTDIAANDNNASVAMAIRGDGDLKIRMEVGIDDAHAPAGRHCADVVLTVTGH